MDRYQMLSSYEMKAGNTKLHGVYLIRLPLCLVVCVCLCGLLSQVIHHQQCPYITLISLQSENKMK